MWITHWVDDLDKKKHDSGSFETDYHRNSTSTVEPSSVYIFYLEERESILIFRCYKGPMGMALWCFELFVGNWRWGMCDRNCKKSCRDMLARPWDMEGRRRVGSQAMSRKSPQVLSNDKARGSRWSNRYGEGYVHRFQDRFHYSCVVKRSVWQSPPSIPRCIGPKLRSNG